MIVCVFWQGSEEIHDSTSVVAQVVSDWAVLEQLGASVLNLSLLRAVPTVNAVMLEARACCK